MQAAGLDSAVRWALWHCTPEAWAKAALEEYKKTGKKPQGAPNENTDRIV